MSPESSQCLRPTPKHHLVCSDCTFPMHNHAPSLLLTPFTGTPVPAKRPWRNTTLLISPQSSTISSRHPPTHPAARPMANLIISANLRGRKTCSAVTWGYDSPHANGRPSLPLRFIRTKEAANSQVEPGACLPTCLGLHESGVIRCAHVRTHGHNTRVWGPLTTTYTPPITLYYKPWQSPLY